MLPFLRIGPFAIPMYGICLTTGIGLGSFLACRRTKRAGGDVLSLIAIIALTIGLAIVGAYLLYVFVSYGIKNVIQDIANGTWGFLREGGMVFYGGLIGGIAGAFLSAKITKTNLADYCDAIVPCIPLGHAFGRLGCFFGGCCYGIPHDGFLGMCFPFTGVTEPVLAVQLIEAFLNLMVSLFLILYTRKKRPGLQTLYVYLLIYAVERFLLEYLRGDKIRGVFLLSTSQWISLGILLVVLPLLLLPMFKKRTAA